MKRLAVFVEGQTELYFVERLLQEIAGYQHISIHLERKIGAGIITLKSKSANVGDETYFALVCDCQGEGSVKTAIQERKKDLQSKGYETILGLRDLYPLTLADLKRLIDGTNQDLALPGMTIKVVIAVMEVEAWFLKEDRHFIKLHQSLTPSFIKSECGFNPKTDDVTQVKQPSVTLNKIYQLVGRQYKKKYKHAQRTVSLINYENLYAEVTKQVVSLAIFLQLIDEFLASA